MRNMKLQTLTLQNFKGCRELTLELCGKNASVYGDNATGKTTVYDALTWLLFGKDSCGSSEQETIKPLDCEGNVRDHNAVTTVEAVLAVDEQDGGAPRQITLRKEMQESWVSRRGSVNLVFDGNEFRYFWDGVPCKKTEFVRRVGELVNEETFRMLTSVTAFAFDLPWRKRREILYELSGVQAMSDRALLQEAAKVDAHNADIYEALADQIGGGMTLDELKKVLLARKRGLSQTKDQTPARIDELQQQINAIRMIDFSAAEELLRQADAAIRAVDGEIALAEAEKRNPDLERRAADLRAERSTLEAWKAEALRKVGEERDELNQQIKALCDRNLQHRREQEAGIPNVQTLQLEFLDLEHQASYGREEIARISKDAKTCDDYAEEQRAEWRSVNNEAFAGDICPTCRQKLPPDMLQEAIKSHSDKKNKRLEEIKQRGNHYVERAKALRSEAHDIEKKLNGLDEKIVRAKEAIAQAVRATEDVRDLDCYREEMDELTRKIEAISTDETLAKYREKLADINRREANLLAASAESNKDLDEKLSGIKAKRAELLTQQKKQRELLGNRSTLTSLEGRISELENAQRSAVKELEEIDCSLFAIEEFIRYKTHFIEDSVNGLFRLVTFRLFRDQANGGLEERCDVVVDGVPYTALNNGARINAGIDIIRRLAEHYGVRVPLFVDNAESVTRLEDAGTQVIRLVVSEQDKSLRVEV